VATQLAEVVRQNEFDIIFSGVESSDYNGNAVGGMLAELLDMPSVSAVSSFEIENDQVKITRDIDGGKEEVTSQLPMVAIVQKGIAIEPRIASMRGIMMARKKPLKVMEPVNAESLITFNSFELPPAKPPCKMVDPENVEKLVELLQNEAKVF
jgi:electron transfer flavoprotein beta subunit